MKKFFLMLALLMPMGITSFAEGNVKITFQKKRPLPSGGGIGRIPVHIPDLPIDMDFDSQTGIVVVNAAEERRFYLQVQN